MTNPENSSLDYESISIHYKNEGVYALGKDAAVYMEGEEDEYFWCNILKHAKPDKQYEFYYNSNLSATKKREHKSGSGQCAKFYPYTDEQFIVCIDSDYNYLLDSHTFSSTNVIFQTYTYSIENHYCFADNLQDIIRHLTGKNTFDFNIFLTKYSEIVYELFVLSVLSKKKNDGQFSISEFQKTCTISDPLDLFNNGQNELDKLQANVTARELSLHGVYTLQEINTTKQALAQKGLTPTTTYLFIKGHSLIDLEKTRRPKVINNINRKLLNNYHKTKPSKRVTKAAYLNCLRNTITYTGYWQIEKLVDDLKTKL